MTRRLLRETAGFFIGGSLYREEGGGITAEVVGMAGALLFCLRVRYN